MDQNELVFALKPNDEYAHAGSAAALLAHYGDVRGADTGPNGLGQLQFYLADGAPLVVDRSGAAPVLAPAPDGTPVDDPVLLADRIALVLARAQVAFDRSGNAEVKEIRVPHLQGPLPVVVAGLAEWFAPLQVFGAGSPTRGGRVHTALHHVGLAHLFGS